MWQVPVPKETQKKLMAYYRDLFYPCMKFSQNIGSDLRCFLHFSSVLSFCVKNLSWWKCRAFGEWWKESKWICSRKVDMWSRLFLPFYILCIYIFFWFTFFLKCALSLVFFFLFLPSTILKQCSGILYIWSLNGLLLLYGKEKGLDAWNRILMGRDGYRDLQESQARW